MSAASLNHALIVGPVSGRAMDVRSALSYTQPLVEPRDRQRKKSLIGMLLDHDVFDARFLPRDRSRIVPPLSFDILNAAVGILYVELWYGPSYAGVFAREYAAKVRLQVAVLHVSPNLIARRPLLRRGFIVVV